MVAAKEHLGADISFIAELQGDFQVTRLRECNTETCAVHTGGELNFRDTYCYRLLTGEIANVVNDARRHPAVKNLGVTRRLNIGSYIGVPIVLPGGMLYGTLCCISHAPSDNSDREVEFLSVLADIVSAHISERERQQSGAGESYLSKRQRIGRVLESDLPRIVLQPMVDLLSGEYVGVEALARFHSEPVRSPDQWFAEAWEVGLGVELEVRAMQAAIAHLEQIPLDVYMSINLSAKTLISPVFMRAARAADLRRIVFELTEHTVVCDYDYLCEIVWELRGMGAQLAIDDVGAGYSGLNHILQLKPQILKLDLQIIENIHCDTMKQAMVTGMVNFAKCTGMEIIAEGIEVPSQVKTLRDLGVYTGQGYYFSKPTTVSKLYPTEELSLEVYGRR